MKEILYRDYRIVATAEKEEKAWRFHARVSLSRGRRTTQLQGTKRFSTANLTLKNTHCD
jgi:hypothetical protein